MSEHLEKALDGLAWYAETIQDADLVHAARAELAALRQRCEDAYRDGLIAARNAQCGGCRDGEPFVMGPSGIRNYHQARQYAYLCNAERINALLTPEAREALRR